MTVRDATRIMFERYNTMLNDSPNFGKNCMSRDHLIWMTDICLEHINDWPIDKLNRWLGFVQGIMTVQHIITVEDEREISRPIFHVAYESEGLRTPDIINP
jgi:hypothetical protein